MLAKLLSTLEALVIPRPYQITVIYSTGMEVILPRMDSKQFNAFREILEAEKRVFTYSNQTLRLR